MVEEKNGKNVRIWEVCKTHNMISKEDTLKASTCKMVDRVFKDSSASQKMKLNLFNIYVETSFYTETICGHSYWNSEQIIEQIDFMQQKFLRQVLEKKWNGPRRWAMTNCMKRRIKNRGVSKSKEQPSNGFDTYYAGA